MDEFNSLAAAKDDYTCSGCQTRHDFIKEANNTGMSIMSENS